MSSDREDVKREVAAANRVLANLGLAKGITAERRHLESSEESGDPKRLKGLRFPQYRTGAEKLTRNPFGAPV